MLALYMLGFSIAYLALPSGAGALVLFGTVQITMFGGACLGKDVIPPLRWIGALVALGGLSYLLWPSSDVALPFAACLAMHKFAVQQRNPPVSMPTAAGSTRVQIHRRRYRM